MTAVPDENARVALLEKGTIDAAGIVPKLADRVRRNGNYNVLEVRTADARTLALPTRDPVLRDPAVRRALSFAVDREQLVERRAGRRRRARLRPDHEGPLGVRPGRRDARTTRPRPSAGSTPRAGSATATGRAPRTGGRSASRSCTPPPTACARTSRSPFASDLAQGRRPGQARRADLRRDREAPGPGRDGVRLRHARTTPTSSSTRSCTRSSPTDDDAFTELPAHAQRGDRPRARRRARSTLDAAARKAAYARLQAEHAQDASWLWLVRLRHVVAISKRVSGVDPQVEPHAHGFSRGTSWNLEDWTLGPAR